MCIGKTAKRFLAEGETEYQDRLKHYVAFERIELPDIKNAKNLSVEQLKQEEGKEFLKRVESSDIMVLLDERGKQFRSVDFAEFLQQQFNSGHKNMCLVIGGAFGFSKEMYDRANFQVSLSKMTFSHQMIRMIVLEQLYRGMSILRNEPYHHEG